MDNRSGETCPEEVAFEKLVIYLIEIWKLDGSASCRVSNANFEELLQLSSEYDWSVLDPCLVAIIVSVSLLFQ